MELLNQEFALANRLLKDLMKPNLQLKSHHLELRDGTHRFQHLNEVVGLANLFGGDADKLTNKYTKTNLDQ